MPDEFKPLRDIRVVEMTHMIMGPSCGQILAYLGAEVIKVEPPAGDKTRHLTGMGRGFFPSFNRGKRSITLDLKSPAGTSALDRLLETADVLVENFRDQSLAKMGFAPSDLRNKHPKLIVASCKGFLHGPYQDRTAMDEVVQMMSGMAYMTGPKGRPLRIGSSANDIMGGLFGALAVLGALMERHQSGQGRALRIGLFENCLMLVMQHMVQFDLDGREPAPMPEREFSWPIYDIFDTRDQRQIFVGAVTEGHWHILCNAIGLQHLRKDPRLQSKMDQIEARDWTIPIFAEALARRDFAELIEIFEATGIPFSPINRPVDMYQDPHVTRPGGLHHSHLPGGQEFRAPGLPIEVDGATPRPASLDVADVGDDTDAVLSELGLSPSEAQAASGALQAKMA
ncbi:Crotonobetainyl-CoA:carnitine CoA-transferase CaiB [Cribrihabitans marinus]|uniref:Crotonobetainyl-CoA:carnitine CoA-transferase CaiB n=1 Tax=Cribrihabitans marinus TaxID=1227549 RepID=A0A1H7E249_9RHOB|nr:CoA transferase [Cribrihabitans marinus]GGH41786.1 CoA transferase [Cribrihabitans marinus]SEK07918.1 Crotonobetainyl-CoA:carnitine CoA-transferase CaiB [Cribrihabitans marinus]